MVECGIARTARRNVLLPSKTSTGPTKRLAAARKSTSHNSRPCWLGKTNREAENVETYENRLRRWRFAEVDASAAFDEAKHHAEQRRRALIDG